MLKEQDIPFLAIIQETFGSVFEDYGFMPPNEAKWNGAGEYVITVQKGDIEFLFRVDTIYLPLLCRFEIVRKVGRTGNA